MLAQCSRTASSIAISAMPAPSAVKICTPNAASRIRVDAGDEYWLGCLVHCSRQCYQESP